MNFASVEMERKDPEPEDPGGETPEMLKFDGNQSSRGKYSMRNEERCNPNPRSCSG
jgi:hypothetical protein